MSSDPRIVEDEIWETVGVTTLVPGWFNVYREADGSVRTVPCPAVLLKEHRANILRWTAPT